MHYRALLKDHIQAMGEEFKESIVNNAGPEQIKHQVKQLLGKERKREEATKEATFSDWNPPSKEIICNVGSSTIGVVVSRAVDLKSIRKKKIASRGFAEEGVLANSPLCGEVKKKEEMEEISVDAE